MQPSEKEKWQDREAISATRLEAHGPKSPKTWYRHPLKSVSTNYLKVLLKSKDLFKQGLKEVHHFPIRDASWHFLIVWLFSSCLVSAVSLLQLQQLPLQIGSWQLASDSCFLSAWHVQCPHWLITDYWVTYATTTVQLVVRALVVSNSNISLVIAKVLHRNIEFETWRFAQNLGWWHKILLSAVCPWQQVHFQGQTREDWAAAFRRTWHLDSW